MVIVPHAGGFVEFVLFWVLQQKMGSHHEDWVCC